jgi:hypothetical protein
LEQTSRSVGEVSSAGTMASSSSNLVGPSNGAAANLEEEESGFGTRDALLAPQISTKLFCPPVLNPDAPLSQPPFAFLPSFPKPSLPAPTVSATLFSPPARPPLNCWPSFKFLLSLQDTELATVFSARWWPVEEEFQGSKSMRVAGAAGTAEECEGLCAGWGLGMEGSGFVWEDVETVPHCDPL